MKNEIGIEPGIKKLLDGYKKAFRIPENLNYYSKEDYKKAERKYVKITIRFGSDELAQADYPEQSG